MPDILICNDLAHYSTFQFKQPGALSKGEIELSLVKTNPVNIEKSYVPEYIFHILLSKTKIKIGEISFRVCLTEALSKFGGNIGYEIDEQYRGHYYAAKAVILLRDFAKSHGLSKLLITCGTMNRGSVRTCECIGAKLIKIEETETDLKVMRPTCYYVLDLYE